MVFEPPTKRGLNGGLYVSPALMKLSHVASLREPHFAVE
jgi:hypothetical protein